MSAGLVLATVEQPLPQEMARLLEQLADLLEYPGHRFEQQRALAQEIVRHGARAMAGSGEAHDRLVRAGLALETMFARQDRRECEENYTVLFDLTPTCTLDIGYHLFGENYARGELLAGLAGEIAAHGIDTHGELPDHLPVLLRLLARQNDPEDRRLLASLVILPGLRKVAEQLAEVSAAWVDLILAVPAVIEQIVPVQEPIAEGVQDRV